jgi:hypothetical protein
MKKMPSLDRNMNKVFNSSALVSNSAYIPGSRPIPAIPLEQHKLNVDPAPTLIRKKPINKLEYIQNVSLRFLRPPHPPKTGDITIIQEADVQAPPAPPLHIMQRPPSPEELPSLIFRERPPKPPAPIAPRNLVIPGKIIPPPPRKVIVERLPQLPPKPQDIIIERWLGYKRRMRTVQFKPAPAIIAAPPPKNILIKWYLIYILKCSRKKSIYKVSF